MKQHYITAALYTPDNVNLVVDTTYDNSFCYVLNLST